jgi:hypothetical protein
MTMMERQAYWMEKKQSAIDAKRKEKEQEEISQTSFKPNTENSRRTYRPSESRPPLAEPPKEANGNQADKANLSERRNSLKSRVRANSLSTKRSSSRPKERDASTRKDASLERRASASTIETAMSLSRKEDSTNTSEADDVVPEDESTPEPREPATDVPEDTTTVEPTAGRVTEETSEFEEGAFWWKVESGRGHHRVRDGGEFQMWSIYRKKDKSYGAGATLSIQANHK